MTKQEKLRNTLDYLEGLYEDLKDLQSPSDTLSVLDSLISNIELDLRELEGGEDE